MHFANFQLWSLIERRQHTCSVEVAPIVDVMSSLNRVHDRMPRCGLC